jgi:hypothetical protein
MTMKFVIASNAPDQVIRIDTTTLPPSNHLALNDPSANEIYPDFVAGTITVGTGGGSTLWVSDAVGDAGKQVEVEVFVSNAAPVDRLILPLSISSTDVRLLSASFTGTRSESGDPSLQVADDQHFKLDIDWSGAPLAPGSGPVARLLLALDAQAAPQYVYIDTDGEYGLRLAGGSQTVEVPPFGRGTITLRVPTAADDPTLPWAFRLDPNFPNPFNPATQISYILSAAGEVRLEVFNTLGQRVATLVSEFQAAGPHAVTWDGRSTQGQTVPSGVYLYRLSAGTDTALRKMTLLK